MSRVGGREGSKGTGHWKTLGTGLQVPATSACILCRGLRAGGGVEGQPRTNLETRCPRPLIQALGEDCAEAQGTATSLPSRCLGAPSGDKLYSLNSGLFLTSFTTHPAFSSWGSLAPGLIPLSCITRPPTQPRLYPLNLAGWLSLVLCAQSSGSVSIMRVGFGFSLPFVSFHNH